MRPLIDTHALIWFLDGNPALSSAARTAMEDESNERFISHAIPWEMAIKVSLGKLRLQTEYDVIFHSVCDANGFQILAPTVEHYRGLIALPRHHGVWLGAAGRGVFNHEWHEFSRMGDGCADVISVWKYSWAFVEFVV